MRVIFDVNEDVHDVVPVKGGNKFSFAPGYRARCNLRHSDRGGYRIVHFTARVTTCRECIRLRKEGS